MAESLARSLIRLIVTVAIIVALYFFAVRPILDTTNHAIDVTGDAFQGSQGLVDQISTEFDDAGIDDLKLNVASKSEGQRVLRCVQRAQGDVEKMQRCAESARDAGGKK